MAPSNGAAGAIINKQNCTAETSKIQPRQYPKEWRYIDFNELPKWEAKGWHAMFDYARRSDDIRSIVIGWFHESTPQCPTS
jgi:hypothetical protein